MAEISNAGPYSVGPDEPIAPGESVTIELAEVAAGPADKKGYLRKLFGERGGMDYVFVVNGSASLVSVKTRGGQSYLPSATSQNLNSGAYRSVTVTNHGANPINEDDTDKVAVEVGNGDRDEDSQPQFSVKGAVEDIVPGIRLGD